MLHVYDNGYVNNSSFFLEGETVDRNTFETFDTAPLIVASAFLVEYADIYQKWHQKYAGLDHS